jgi:hypothetical protein
MLRVTILIKYSNLFKQCCKLLDTMDWETRGRNKSCPVGRHSPTNCLEKMKRTTNILIRIYDLQMGG